MTVKSYVSAGSAHIGGPLCLYDEAGDAIAMFSNRRPDKERIALAIVEAVNKSGGIDIEPLPHMGPHWLSVFLAKE